jgi:hypothetical protein
MPNYIVSWEEAIWYDLEIEANSKDQAIDKLLSGEYDREDVTTVGQEWVPDTIECEEV